MTAMITALVVVYAVAAFVVAVRVARRRDQRARHPRH